MLRNYFYNDKPVFIALLFILLAVVLVPARCERDSGRYSTD